MNCIIALIDIQLNEVALFHRVFKISLYLSLAGGRIVLSVWWSISISKIEKIYTNRQLLSKVKQFALCIRINVAINQNAFGTNARSFYEMCAYSCVCVCVCLIIIVHIHVALSCAVI